MSVYLFALVRPIRLSLFEILLLIFTASMVVSGIVIANINVQWFENVYAVEDGFIENWTIVPLLMAVFIACYRLATTARQKKWQFNATLILVVIFSVFIAGEEISWGQRILNVESSNFFKQNNTQGETNFHNLMVADKKINKIIFSQFLTVSIGFYLLALPFLYSRAFNFRKLVERWGIPIPQPYQIFSCLLLFASIIWIPSGKNAEILEAGITTLFLLIYAFPKNALSAKLL